MSAPALLVDTHAHPMDPALAGDRNGVLARAREAGIGAIVCVGYDVTTSRAAVELSERESMCFAAVGIHPNYIGEASDADLQEVEELSLAPRVVAIGETGLDYYRGFSDASAQRDWFKAHLALAQRRGLPVIVHNREANDDMVDLLRTRNLPGGSPSPTAVLHCFSGGPDLAREAQELGCMISFAGTVTFKNATQIAAAARICGSDRILLETDCPYLSPHPLRGQRNEPARVRIIAEHVAGLRETSFEALCHQTTANAVRVFPLLASTFGLDSAGAQA